MRSLLFFLSFFTMTYLFAETRLAINPYQSLKNTPPTLGFRYFAGDAENFHNHPAIYAAGYQETAKLVVVGKDFYQEFPLQDFNAAVNSYKQLLEARNYLDAE